ncbi:MAG: bifunctional DNA primase/polymerase [Anaerolineae bacterium]
MPTADELRSLFVDQHFSAYGVVCGRLSKLVVLDLDDEVIAEEFAAQFPDFGNTYTVRSGNRGTPHFLFHVDLVKSQKVRGGDLKAEGGYVVGAGSVIAGKSWTVVRDVPVLALNRDKLEVMLDFLKPQQQIFNACHNMKEATPDSDSVVSEYQREVERTGERNNTLFRLALKLRDQGMPQIWAQQALAEVHAHQGSDESQTSERFDRRLCEAQKTIASAYSRPRRAEQRFTPTIDQPDHIDNGIREALLQYPDGTAFLRVYEGLIQRGFVSNQTFTRLEALAALKGIVGDYSLRKALKLCINGERLIPEILSPSPSIPANADPGGVVENKAKRCFVPQQKSTRSRKGQLRHRPPTQYRLSSPEELRRILGVIVTVSDPVHEADLTSPKAYRAALEREFIKRRPGQYPQTWLAKRLGVTARSIYSYHAAESIQAEETFESLPLTWDNLEQVIPSPLMARLAGVDTQSWFMEDQLGRRFPAKSGLVYKLMGQGRRLTLKKRTFSTYKYIDPVLETAVWWEILHPKQDSAWHLTQPKTEPLQLELPAPMPKSPPEIKKRQPYYRTALEDEDDERAAQRVYQTIERLSGAKTLSLSNSRCLVDLYGSEVVVSTLRRMEALHHKGEIAHHAGFLITAARVSWRTTHHVEAFASAPRLKGERRTRGSKVFHRENGRDFSV